MIIRGVLKEELDNSLRLEKEYQKELSKIPKGSLLKRERKGHYYYYLQVREGDKVKQIYKGKLPQEEVKRYRQSSEYRKKYKKQLSDVKKQIKYLKGILGGKRTKKTV